MLPGEESLHSSTVNNGCQGGGGGGRASVNNESIDPPADNGSGCYDDGGSVTRSAETLCFVFVLFFFPSKRAVKVTVAFSEIIILKGAVFFII